MDNEIQKGTSHSQEIDLTNEALVSSYLLLNNISIISITLN